MKKIFYILLLLFPYITFAQSTYKLYGPIQQQYIGDTTKLYHSGTNSTFWTSLGLFDFLKPIRSTAFFQGTDTLMTKAEGRALISTETDPIWTSAQPYYVTRVELGDTALQLRTDLAGGGGITPTSGIFYWNSVTNKYEPYTSMQIGFNFYTSGTTPNNASILYFNGQLSPYGIFANNVGTNTYFDLTNNSGKGIFIDHSSLYSAISIDNNNSAGTGIVVQNTNAGTALDLKTNNYGSGGLGLQISAGVSSGAIPLIIKKYTGSVWDTTFVLNPNISDGSTAIAFNLDTYNSLSTTGAKLISIKNNGSEKASIDKDGKLTALQYFVSSLNTAPSSATDTGTAGEIRICSDYIYVCIATDTWVRTALTTW